MDRTIIDAMHRGVVTCQVTSTAEEIARIMIDNDVATVVVTDERFDACGVLTKTDLIGHYGLDLAAVTAEDIMSPSLITVSPDTLVHEAVSVMLRHSVHQLVILTEGGVHHRPVGIFTSGDAVSLMAGNRGPSSEAQVKCSECIRRFLSTSSNREADEQ